MVDQYYAKTEKQVAADILIGFKERLDTALVQNKALYESYKVLKSILKRGPILSPEDRDAAEVAIGVYEACIKVTNEE